MLTRQGLQKFPHRPAFAALRLFETPADAAQVFEDLLIVDQLLIRFRTLHHYLRLAVHGKDGGIAGRFEFRDVVACVALELAEGVDIGEVERQII